MGRKLAAIIVLLACFLCVHAVYALEWNEVIDTQAEHDSNIPGTNHPHFTKAWRTTDTWDGSEGYYRWTCITEPEEDDDGYAVEHPNTGSNSVYVSWMARVGADWWDHVETEYKFALFYPTDSSPRPMMAPWHVQDGGSVTRYLTWGAAADANSEGWRDEFGEQYPNYNYPDHTFKVEQGGYNGSSDQWWFIVFGVDGNYTKLYIYSQDGTISGLYATSAEKSGGYSETWDIVRLLAYIEGTTAGANAYIDICHISVHNSLPSPPAGFLNGASETVEMIEGTFQGTVP